MYAHPVEPKTKTHLPLLYIKDGKTEVLPHLDLSRLDQIWGIMSSGYAIKLTHQPFRLTWTETQSQIQTLAQESFGGTDFEVFIPPDDGLRHCYYYRHEFSATVELLVAHKIKADKWLVALYWCAGFGFGSRGKAFHMGACRQSFHSKELPCYVRLARFLD